jgi:hypothetical protein
MSLSYGFNERMKMSDGVAATTDVESILLREIPGAVTVSRAAGVNDRQGVDWWVEMSTARHLAVDAKVRSKDFALKGEDDLALETWSVVEEKVIGWTRDDKKRCDYVLWFWVETRRFCLVPFPMLCGVFADKWEAWKKQYKCKQQETPWKNGTSYHSECVFVPRREVWAEIYRRYSGNLLVEQNGPTPEPVVVETAAQAEFWESERSPY